MNEQLLSQELTELIELVKQLCEPIDYSDERSKFSPMPNMHIFMRKILELYLLMQQNPSIKSKPEVQDYLNQSASMMSESDLSIFHHFMRVLMGISRSLSSTFYKGDQWYSICWRRSALQAFDEIYRGTSYKEFVEDDYESLDEEIRQVGRMEGGGELERIPRYMPPSHWWWWYPDAPPCSQDF
jgi:hypothetical protein